MITLEEAKTHLRVDLVEDDDAILAMIETATAHIQNYTGIEYNTVDAPAPVKSAALLLVGDLYEHREAQSDTAIYTNRTFLQLLNPYRAMSL
jgi:uncharacterized phage protein (predicted DNA packaging)